MKEIVFSKSSSGYKFLCWLNDNYKHRPPTDICSFGRALVWNSLVHLFWVGVVLFFVTFVGAASISGGAFTGFVTKATFANHGFFMNLLICQFFGLIALIGLVAAVVVFCSVCWLLDKTFYAIKNWIVPPKAENQPGPIKSAYRAFKEKTCYKIKFD